MKPLILTVLLSSLTIGGGIFEATQYKEAHHAQDKIASRRYEAFVTKVHDGDTVYANISLGFNVTVAHSIRLKGINAPELSSGLPAKNATRRLRELVYYQNVIIETDPRNEFEKYGRVLATIHINGTNVNQLLIQEGLAKEYIP